MEKVARYWSEPKGAAFDPENYWAAIPAVQRRLNRLATGQEDCTWIDYCIQRYLTSRLPLPYCLSLGCGDGWLERALARRGVFEQCDAMDIAPGAIERAQRMAREAGWTHINYQIADLNTVSLPANRYDAIWIHHSYHHVARVEHLAREIAHSLTEEGFLFLCDYVGPARFQFLPRQRMMIQKGLQLLPPSYRKLSPFAQSQEEKRAGFLARNPTKAISRLYDKVRGGDLWPAVWRKVQVGLWLLTGLRRRKNLLKTRVFLPTTYDVASVDPSEAICSDQILPVLQQYLEIIEFKPLGGNILHFLLDDIAHNFIDDDPVGQAWLRALFALEDAFLAEGVCASDFVFLVARRGHAFTPCEGLVRQRNSAKYDTQASATGLDRPGVSGTLAPIPRPGASENGLSPAGYSHKPGGYDRRHRAEEGSC